MSEYVKQELLPQDVRSDILRKIMMLKSYFKDNMTASLKTFEYNYVAEALIKQCGHVYSNRDLFDIQVWAQKVPEYLGQLYRKESNFDLEIVDFMDSVGLNWDCWGVYRRAELKEPFHD